MNAKEYNIVVTVVCKLKIKTEPQLSDQTKMPISQQHGADVRGTLHISVPHKAASVHLLIFLKTKPKQTLKTKPTFFYINNKNLVTKIIKPNLDSLYSLKTPIIPS